MSIEPSRNDYFVPEPAAVRAEPTGMPGQNGMALAGMVLGIIGVAGFWIPFVGFVCAILAIIFSAIGMAKAKHVGGAGKGKAVAGLVMGIAAIVILLIAVFVVVGTRAARF
jgi:hypothetical protein